MKKKTEKKTWAIEWRKYTKDSARRDLASFVMDRPIDESWVNALCRSMDMGLWDVYSPSQTPIAYDINGNRLNGKHRLAAFVRSKLDEIVFPVVTGLDPDDYRSFDQNTKMRQKTAAHPDRKYVSRDIARINWIEAIVSGETQIRITTPVFEKLADGRWRRQLVWAGEVLPRSGRQAKAPYTSAFMYVHRCDPEFADKVGKAWANGGSGLPSQLIRLRDDALSAKDTKRAALRSADRQRSTRFGATLKVLNALSCMHSGRPMPERLTDSLYGLRYFSEKMKDGAITRWEKRSAAGVEE